MSDSHKFTMSSDETLRKMSDSHKFTMGSDETLVFHQENVLSVSSLLMVNL